jgi:two-component system, chemotaxis family, sensor kinase CheA
MSLDLSQFHETFFAESFEALDSMEAALLKLDIGAPDPELINTVFRVAHSIKGGSATFGFTDIASFTHSLETLLDELRANRLAVSAAISDLLLKSVDVMRELLRAVQGQRPIDAQRMADLQFDLELAILNRAGGSAARQPPAAAEAVAPAAVPERSWSIVFHPSAQFFTRGNDPLRMLRELSALGRLEVSADLQLLPPVQRLDPQLSYLAWTIRLTGPADKAAIQDVFDWATGDCDLTIELDSAAAESAPPTDVPDAPPAESVAERAAARGSGPTAAPAEPRRAPIETAPAKPEPLPLSAVGPGPESGSIRVSVEKIDELMNTVGELVITQAMLSQLGSALQGPSAEPFRAGLAQLERNMRELQESVMRVRMLPISFVFNRFPRMVRDLAQRLGKQIELRTGGEQTELDKTLLEKIGDPLVHLVRNSVDHGIEKREVRLAAGKAPTGVVRLEACHRGGNIAIEVSDDGGGLDRDKILTKARERGFIGANDVLSEAEVCDLIFLPGFSTASETTDVSGRGVGMDVVRRNIKELCGKIEVHTERGRGSRFTITLPLTLAIVDGQSVAVGRETYIVPLTSIVESLQLKSASVSRIGSGGELFAFRGSFLPIVRLHRVFGVEARARELHEGLVVVVEGAGRRIGLFVDDLLGQQQVVIKSLETNYGHVAGVSGATILGDGSVALILDVPGLIQLTALRAAA